MRTDRPGGALQRAALLIAGGLLVAGCAAEATPADRVPAIDQGLARVDEAIVAGHHDQARKRLDHLIAVTTDAREAGTLEAADADRIVAAAVALMSALPAEAGRQRQPSERGTASPASPATASTTPSPVAPTDTGETEDAEEPAPTGTSRPRGGRGDGAGPGGDSPSGGATPDPAGGEGSDKPDEPEKPEKPDKGRSGPGGGGSDKADKADKRDKPEKPD